MNDPKKPQISAIIVTYMRPAGLVRCLECLLNQTVPLARIIVVDNAPAMNRDTYNVCTMALWNGLVQYVKNPLNSLPAGRNFGASLCETEFVALIDDDVRVGADYIARVLEVFRNEPHALGVQGYIEPPPLAPLRELVHRTFCLYHHEKEYCRVLASVSTTYAKPLTAVAHCEWISGSNQVYRHWVLQQIKWDEQLLKYADGEDLDHSFRVHCAWPGRLYITPFAIVQHDELPSGRALGYELIAMREVYGWYLHHKLFEVRSSARLTYLWSRLGRLMAALCVAVTARRKGAASELASLLRAYWFVIRHSRQIRNGRLECFNVLLKK